MLTWFCVWHEIQKTAMCDWFCLPTNNEYGSHNISETPMYALFYNKCTSQPQMIFRVIFNLFLRFIDSLSI